MRDKELKKLLQDNVTPPDYLKKDSFIRGHRAKETPHVSTTRLILQQTGFIRKRVWVVSLLVMIFMVLFIVQEMRYPLNSGYTDDDRVLTVLKTASFFMPFISALGMIEAFKAQLHGVYELEQVTVISGKRALFARLAVVGIINFLPMMFISVLMRLTVGVEIVRGALVVLVPYLLTMVLCMEIERFEWARRSAFSFLIPVLLVTVLTHSEVGGMYFAELGVRALLIIFVALVAVQAFELKRFSNMEDFAWN
ncbi:MAG: hypothetical protein J5802_08595 [Butyrivibrio sp.]|nr:hypothetical protein [Butyrivibrio sp.]